MGAISENGPRFHSPEDMRGACGEGALFLVLVIFRTLSEAVKSIQIFVVLFKVTSSEMQHPRCNFQ